MPRKRGTEVVERQDIETFLYREAQLLDDAQLDDWLALFTDDAVYWIPCNRDDVDPDRGVSIVYDDRQRMEERIWRLKSGLAWAQEPSSRTRHLIGNVMLVSSDADDVVVSSNFGVFELRRGVQQTFSGRYEHHLKRVNGSWRIARKKVELLNNNEPIDNLTFIL